MTSELVLQVLQPIGNEDGDREQAARPDQSVLDYAAAVGWRHGDNPARWRGHLAHMLPKPSKVQPVVHHAAAPWSEIPQFMAQLRQREGVAGLGPGILILTAARSGEVRLATWDEIDREAMTWTVPARHMKGGREHRVPLSAGALAVLGRAAALRTEGGLLFPGQRAGRPLSDMSLTSVLRRMGRGDLTAHGFRSSFRDWCSETGRKPGKTLPRPRCRTSTAARLSWRIGEVTCSAPACAYG